MTISKEAFVDLHEKYNKVIKLIVDDSKQDPENEPYLSKYSARQNLINMKANLENLLRNQTAEGKDRLKITVMLAAVQLYLGIVAIDTDELSVGKSHLEKCQELIKDHEDKPEVLMVTLNMYNQFGLLHSQSDPDQSKIYLEHCEQLYLNFKKLSVAPVDISDLFEVNLEKNNEELGWKNLEKVHTFTLYYLAQIYGALKDALKSAVYCHNTLQRQLETQDYDAIDWALNAATLSQFFMEKNGFKQARHHLAASSYILEKYETELNQITDRNEAYDAKMEQFKHRSADVARCWAKYGILLLSKSKERLLNHTDDDTDSTQCTIASDLSNLQLSDDSTVSREDLQNLQFTSLDLSTNENQITCDFVLTIQDARLVFQNIQGWLQKAAQYYTLENLASDHIQIVQDQSQMYLNLLFFEDNPENQAKLHKRRIDLLEDVVSKVNPQYYLQYCRQIWFELAQTYSDVLNIKSDKLRETKGRPAPHALTKINHLIDSSIQHYNNFIQSFKEGFKGEIPSKIHDDYEKPFLQAYFNIAAINGRFITLDKQLQLRNTEASYEAYKKVCEYCDRNTKAQELIPMELSICREMVTLLPVKIAKLRLEASEV